MSALQEHFVCDSVATLGGLFVAAYRQKPELILLADSLPGLDLERSIAKIRTAAGRTQPSFVLLGKRFGPEEHVRGLAGHLRELPEPDLLRSTLQQLLQNDGIDPHDCRTWVARLESQFTDAVRECFSSMLGREVRPAVEAVSDTDVPSWSIELRPPVGGCLLRGSLYAVEDVGRAAAMDMLGLGESELDAEIVESCMSETLNLFGGRLKAAAGDLEVDLRLGLPERSARREGAAYEWRQVFYWDEDLKFEAVVEAYEDAAVVPAV